MTLSSQHIESARDAAIECATQAFSLWYDVVKLDGGGAVVLPPQAKSNPHLVPLTETVKRLRKLSISIVRCGKELAVGIAEKLLLANASQLPMPRFGELAMPTAHELAHVVAWQLFYRIYDVLGIFAENSGNDKLLETLNRVLPSCVNLNLADDAWKLLEVTVGELSRRDARRLWSSITQGVKNIDCDSSEFRNVVPVIRYEAARAIATFQEQNTKPVDSDCDTSKPQWEKRKGLLSYGGNPVRKIKNIHQAKNIVRVLDAFEEKAWPPTIVDPVGRSMKQRRSHLRETVRSLNEGIATIRFQSDGTGTGITWSVDESKTG